MLISYNWLKDFTDIKITPEELAERLTMAGIEVGSIEKLKDDFEAAGFAMIIEYS